MNELLAYSDIDAARDEIDSNGDVVPVETEPLYTPPPVSVFDDRLVGSIEAIESGPSVTLADRAVALAAIMSYYNKHSMTEGSKKQLAIPGSEFNTRYANPEDVQAGAERIVKVDLYPAFLQGIAMLEAIDSPYEFDGNGVMNLHPDVVATKYMLNETYLGKSSKAAIRNKVVEAAWRIAKQQADR